MDSQSKSQTKQVIRITAIGQSGCGKSTLAWQFAENFPRLFTFDRTGEHDPANYTHVAYNFEEFCEHILKTETSKNFRILYNFDIESDGHDEEFNEACRLIYYRGDCAVLFEEVWNYSGRAFIPKWMKEMFLTGRHKGIHLLTTSQRPADTHKTIISQSTSLYCGYMFESNDIVYVSNFIGKENSVQLRQLPKFKFLHYRQSSPIEFITNKG